MEQSKYDGTWKNDAGDELFVRYDKHSKNYCASWEARGGKPCVEVYRYGAHELRRKIRLFNLVKEAEDVG